MDMLLEDSDQVFTAEHPVRIHGSGLQCSGECRPDTSNANSRHTTILVSHPTAQKTAD
jgi:hypothetical protein